MDSLENRLGNLLQLLLEIGQVMMVPKASQFLDRIGWGILTTHRSRRFERGPWPAASGAPSSESRRVPKSPPHQGRRSSLGGSRPQLALLPPATPRSGRTAGGGASRDEVDDFFVCSDHGTILPSGTPPSVFRQPDRFNERTSLPILSSGHDECRTPIILRNAERTSTPSRYNLAHACFERFDPFPPTNGRRTSGMTIEPSAC